MIDIENYLSNFFGGTRKLSLDTMKYFMEEYHNFQKEMKFIHIAGTNGKGSCTEMISNILCSEGYKVGKFLSPHLVKYNERISINGIDISDQEMSDMIEELEPKIKEHNEKVEAKITLFELETIMALLYFYRKNVDFVILETGLGGIYDSTNIISNPLISVIVSIGFDHMHLLGNTLSEIAYQKAGIIKENSNTVVFENTKEVDDVFRTVCCKKHNTLHLVTKEKIKNDRYDENFQYFDYENLKNIAINLKGAIQINNASLCIECVKILNDLGYPVSEASLRHGLLTVIHKGRMETLSKEPLVVYDGAHNTPAMLNLQKSVRMYYHDRKRRYVVSILRRKDYEGMLKILLEDTSASFVFTSGNDKTRYVDKEELYHVAMKYRKEGQALYMQELEEAIENIFSSNEKCVNLIVGSFYVYGDVNQKIREMKDKRRKR
ncbi:MAG: Mur ligase family protein [Clostridia bacterium]|nr:Mur ligase family protein [Clostridia bacterium]